MMRRILRLRVGGIGHARLGTCAPPRLGGGAHLAVDPADRRSTLHRTRYDAEPTVAAFAARLRDEVDLEQLGAEILATVSAAVEPSSASLWLRE